MLYTTLAQYDTAIARKIAQIERMETIGQSYSDSTSGNSRSVTEADIEKAYKQLERLQRERNMLQTDNEDYGTPIIDMNS